MKKMTIKIEGGHWKSKIDNIHEHLNEVNRGNGKHRTKKEKVLILAKTNTRSVTTHHLINVTLLLIYNLCCSVIIYFYHAYITTFV